jgi:hypothetical protein
MAGADVEKWRSSKLLSVKLPFYLVKEKGYICIEKEPFRNCRSVWLQFLFTTVSKKSFLSVSKKSFHSASVQLVIPSMIRRRKTACWSVMTRTRELQVAHIP